MKNYDDNMKKKTEKSKCTWGDGITVKPDGVHELDPCVYEDIEIHRNVTVIVSRCIRCGNIVVSWKSQENTIDDLWEDT